MYCQNNLTRSNGISKDTNNPDNVSYVGTFPYAYVDMFRDTRLTWTFVDGRRTSSILLLDYSSGEFIAPLYVPFWSEKHTKLLS